MDLSNMQSFNGGIGALKNWSTYSKAVFGSKAANTCQGTEILRRNYIEILKLRGCLS